MSLFLFPLIISSKITPKLKTSDFTENTPPLHILEPCTRFLDTKTSLFVCLFVFFYLFFFNFLLKKPIRREIKEEVAYYVPTTLMVLSIFWFSLQILAIPKSNILATMSWSNNTLLGFKSLLIGQECIDPL